MVGGWYGIGMELVWGWYEIRRGWVRIMLGFGRGAGELVWGRYGVGMEVVRIRLGIGGCVWNM